MRNALCHWFGVTVASFWLFAIPHFAYALETPWQGDELLEGRLLVGQDAVGSGSIPALLELSLKEGWKTYWRTPGDSGLPPTLEWMGSKNLASHAIAWPAPHRASLLGFETIAYDGVVGLPLQLQASDAAAAMALQLRADILVCEEQCIPKTLNFTLDIPSGTAKPTRHARVIADWQSKIPTTPAQAGLWLSDLRLEAGTPKKIRARLKSSEVLTAPDIFLEHDPYIAFAKPAIALDADKLGGEVSIALSDGVPPGVALEKSQLRVTITDQGRASEAVMAVGSKVAAEQQGEGGEKTYSLWLMLILALAGGFILNFMPCVLPVLSLKLLAISSHGGAAKNQIRASFLASAAGIMVFFMALALVLMGLKQAGAAIGWGIQFQQPVFLGFMLLLVLGFAANLWGWFDIPLPRWLADSALHGGDSSHGHWVGHFSTGLFAALLATPCSAPFLGTAVAFALAGSSTETLVIFAALGVGLALPYLLLVIAPGLAQRMPRPGAWMVKLKAILGWLLLATALWLWVVLWAQLGLVLAGILALAAAIILFALWKKQHLLALLLAVLFLSLVILRGDNATPSLAQDSQWQEFSESALSQAIADGKIVFVDITATWCLTCHANKRLVLMRHEVAEALMAKGVVRLRGDWTLRDDAITAFLAKHNRAGIPFNAVYSQQYPDGIILPEILSSNLVLNALQQARVRTD